jgi:hypothetical protein
MARAQISRAAAMLTSDAGGAISPRWHDPAVRMNVWAHPKNYARRQQHRRLLRAGEAAAGGTIIALLGLVAASLSAGYLAAGLLLCAITLGLYSRHWISLARRSAVGARSEDAVQRALAPLQTEGWRLRHSLRWRGQGDIDSVAIAPNRIAVARPRRGRTTLAISRAYASRRPGWPVAGDGRAATAGSRSSALSGPGVCSASSRTCWWSRSIG